MERMDLVRRTVGVLLVFAVLFLAASLLTFRLADIPGEMVGSDRAGLGNLCGPLGARVAFGLLRWVGVGAYVLVAVCAGWGLSLLFVHERSETWLKLTGSALLVVVVSTVTALPGTGSLVAPATGNGGFVG